MAVLHTSADTLQRSAAKYLCFQSLDDWCPACTICRDESADICDNEARADRFSSGSRGPLDLRWYGGGDPLAGRPGHRCQHPNTRAIATSHHESRASRSLHADTRPHALIRSGASVLFVINLYRSAAWAVTTKARIRPILVLCELFDTRHYWHCRLSLSPA